MEKQSNEEQIESNRYHNEREKCILNHKPFMVMNQSHILSFSSLMDKAQLFLIEKNQEGFDEIITELTITYKDLYESNHLQFSNDVYFGMAVFMVYNVENIPKNKKYADETIKRYFDEKRQQEKTTAEYKEMINGKQDAE